MGVEKPTHRLALCIISLAHRHFLSKGCKELLSAAGGFHHKEPRYVYISHNGQRQRIAPCTGRCPPSRAIPPHNLPSDFDGQIPITDPHRPRFPFRRPRSGQMDRRSNCSARRLHRRTYASERALKRETALMIWWAIGWGGWVDSQMLHTMRRCSARGARDVLAAAASRGWLECRYVNSRRAVYRVSEVARIAAAAELGIPQLARLVGFRAKIADGQFVQPNGWPHAREAAIATSKIAKLYLPEYPIEPHWVFPMGLLPQDTLDKTPDAMLIGMDFCAAFEYERSRKSGRQKRKHSTWETLERYIREVSAGTARFYENEVTEIVIAPHDRCAKELERHLHAHCSVMATEHDQVIRWGWYYKDKLELCEEAPGDSCE